MRTFDVLVPKKTSYYSELIIKGSAIIGIDSELNPNDAYVIYWEGNLYNAKNLQTFEQKALSAISRFITKYPTMATGRCPKSSMDKVGEITFDKGKIVNLSLSNKDKFNEWNIKDVDISEGA